MKILLADDHALFRDGMRYVLRKMDEQAEVLEAGSFPEALQLAADNPDIELILLDLNMPGSKGAPSVRVFHKRYPDIPLVVISGTDLRDDIEKVMNSGAMGFISKTSTSATMVHALRMVLGGDIYLPPQLLQQASASLDQGRDRRSTRSDESGLTPRQAEVLQHLAKGLTNKEIAEATGLAEGTVKIHTAGVYQALSVNSRLEAVHAAQLMGLITAED